MKIRVVIETNEVRGDKSQMKPEAIERLKETVKDYLESNTQWEVKSVKFIKGSLITFYNRPERAFFLLSNLLLEGFLVIHIVLIFKS